MNDGDTPRTTAQGTCARCRTVIPFADLHVFAGRSLCPTCHGELVALSRPPDFPPGTPPLAPGPPWQRFLVRLAQARLSIAVARCSAYLAAFALMGPIDEQRGSLFMAALVGAYAADNFTWLIFRLIDLPMQIASFPVETALTIGTGALLISHHGLMPFANDGPMVAMSFPVFLLVLAVKTGLWWNLRSAASPTE